MWLPACARAEALEKAEQLAEAGEVDQAMMLQQQAEAYSRQHEEMFKRLTAPEKTMIVCDICGVFINSTDNDQRRRVSGLARAPCRQWLRVRALVCSRTCAGRACRWPAQTRVRLPLAPPSGALHRVGRRNSSWWVGLRPVLLLLLRARTVPAWLWMGGRGPRKHDTRGMAGGGEGGSRAAGLHCRRAS